jgi:hypothetical protein
MSSTENGMSPMPSTPSSRCLCPHPGAHPARAAVPLGVAQADNPPDDPKMIELYAAPLDADVEWVGDGPVPPEPVGNDDPAPGIP